MESGIVAHLSHHIKFIPNPWHIAVWIGDVWCSGIRMHAGKEIVDAEVGHQYSEEREEHNEVVFQR